MRNKFKVDPPTTLWFQNKQEQIQSGVVNSTSLVVVSETWCLRYRHIHSILIVWMVKNNINN